MDRISKLSVWMESLRDAWAEKGVGAAEICGQNIFPIVLPKDGDPSGLYSIYIGDKGKALQPWAWPENDFIRIDFTTYMGIEHIKLLIENAVDQKAER